MNPLEEAKQIRRVYNRRLERLIRKAHSGDKESTEKLIPVISELHTALREIGYREVFEDGKQGKLVPVNEKN